MRFRRLAVLVAFSLLLISLLRRNSVEELRSRVTILRRFAAEDLRTRRMAGTSVAYDRRFFEFLERARPALPPGTKGLALYAPGIPEWAGYYVAVYHLAPLPVADAPKKIAEGWVAAIYGAERPSGWRLLRELPNGALLLPP